MDAFNANIDLLPWQIADMLCDHEKQAMWVLARMAAQVEASALQQHIDEIEEDPVEVVQFLRELADLIEAGLESEAA